MDLNIAKEVMDYFGFRNNNIEPTLCVNKNKQVGLFITFKTLYGHLSRFITFKDKQDMEKFMKIYSFYRAHSNEKNINVVFDEYETLTPNILIYYNNILITENNLNDLDILNNNIEQLEIDTTLDENIELLKIIKKEIIDFVENIKNTEKDLQKINKIYKEKINEYKDYTSEDYEEIECNLESIDETNILKRIELIMLNITDANFDNKYNELIETYKNVLNNEKYFHNIYCIEQIKNEIENLNTLKNKYEEYLDFINKKSSLFKKKIDFKKYLENNPIEKRKADKKDIYDDLKIKNSSLVIKWINNSYDDLKIINGITTKNSDSNTKIFRTNSIDLQRYFESLDKRSRNECLIISSPLKELINIIINFDSKKNIYNSILNEQYYKNKFNDIYTILSNKDNYSLARKYLKLIKLDSLEEFVTSLIDFVNNFNVEPITLNTDDILKYKMGIILKKGFINASLKNEYPINFRGDNNYYISYLKTNVKAYYSPYIIRFDDNDILQAKRNESIITFNMDNLKISDNSKIKINNYMLKRVKEGSSYNFDFVLFNEKVYLETYIEEK